MNTKHLLGSKWTRHLPPRPDDAEEDPSEDRRCHFVVTALHQKTNTVTMKGVLGVADLLVARADLNTTPLWRAGWSSPSRSRKKDDD